MGSKVVLGKASVALVAFAAGLFTHSMVSTLVLETEPQEPVVVVVKRSAPVSQAVAPAEPVLIPPTRPAPNVLRTKVVAAPPTPAPTAVSTAARTGNSLAEEFRIFESGRTAMVAGNFPAAVSEFRQYLANHPHGALTVEALQGLFDALAAQGAWSQAEREGLELSQKDLGAVAHARVLSRLAVAEAHFGKCTAAMKHLGEAARADGATMADRQSVTERCPPKW